MTDDEDATDAPFAMFAHPDFSGVLRGKAFGGHRLKEALTDGLAWVPANLLISPLGTIPAENPFGPMGEITLRADRGTRFELPENRTAPTIDFYLADVFDLTGRPWICCPRATLRAAVADLQAETGVTLKLAFEHEFTLIDFRQERDPSFSLAAMRRYGDLLNDIDEILTASNIELEQITPEYAAGQFEISSTPADPSRACDEATLCREVIRDVARSAGLQASFLPKPRLDQAGNGVHAHFSLWDRDGRPVTAQEGRLTPQAGSFAAGLIAHADALLLFTTASTNSFLRIRPRSWVGAYACFGERNREAMIRFCPRNGGAKASLEFRVMDATANAYLAVAGLIRAGLDGMRRGLPAPANVTVDPATLSDADAAAMGVRPLPSSLEAVLEAASAPGALTSHFPQPLIEALLCVRRADLTVQMEPAELAAALAAVY